VVRPGRSQYAQLAPLFEYYGVQLWMPEAGGQAIEQSRLLAALIPGSRLAPLDSSNHLLPERDPAWKHFLAEIDRFLPGLR
jgi:hypothetical protein